MIVLHNGYDHMLYYLSFLPWNELWSAAIKMFSIVRAKTDIWVSLSIERWLEKTLK
jgi:hypothetical protein